VRSIRESFLDQPVSVSRCEAGEPSSIPGAHSFASFCMAMGDFCKMHGARTIRYFRLGARRRLHGAFVHPLVFNFFGLERICACSARLCLLVFQFFSAWRSFGIRRPTFGLPDVWNKRRGRAAASWIHGERARRAATMA